MRLDFECCGHGELWNLAAQQHGVVSRAQLVELGLTRGRRRALVQSGRLEVAGRNTLRVVGTPSTPRQGLLIDCFDSGVLTSVHAFATDPLALHVANRAIDVGHDAKIDAGLRFFFYLPFEHSEAIADQDRAVELFTSLGNANLLGYANAHRDVIARFGRFPHRNAALGRGNTTEEQAWLAAGGGF